MAAATYVVVGEGWAVEAGQQPMVIVADRPFLFVVRYQLGGAIGFEERVLYP